MYRNINDPIGGLFSKKAYKHALSMVESSGGVALDNESSSAAGNYHFLYKLIQHDPDLEGISKREFINRPELHEKIMDKALAGNLTGYSAYGEKYANKLIDEFGSNKNTNEIAALVHFLGPGNTRNYLRDPENFNVPGKTNATVNQYLERFNSSYDDYVLKNPEPIQMGKDISPSFTYSSPKQSNEDKLLQPIDNTAYSKRDLANIVSNNQSNSFKKGGYTDPTDPPSEKDKKSVLDYISNMNKDSDMQSARSRANSQSIRPSDPKQSFGSKSLEVALNPMTAAGYAARGKDLPDNFSRGPRNPLDYAVDVANPFQYVQDTKNVVQGAATGDGMQFLEGAIGVAPMGLLGDAAKKGLKSLRKYPTGNVKILENFIEKGIEQMPNPKIRKQVKEELERFKSKEGQKRLKEIGVSDDNFKHLDDNLEIYDNPESNFVAPEVHGVKSDKGETLLEKQADKIASAGKHDLYPENIAAHEVAHLIQPNTKEFSTIDKYFDELEVKETIDNFSKDNLNYAFSDNKGSMGFASQPSKEKFAFLREMRQSMKDKNYIKDVYGDISDSSIIRFMNENPKDRITSFIKNNKKNVGIVKKLLNSIPAAVPVAGVGVGAMAQSNEFKQGGDLDPTDPPTKKDRKDVLDYISNMNRESDMQAERDRVNSQSIRPSAKQSFGSKAFEVALNPMTAAGYVARNESLPDNFSRGPRNALDYAVDMINPAQYANDLKNLVQGTATLDGGQALEGALGVVPIPLLGEGIKNGAKNLSKQAKKLVKKSKKSKNPEFDREVVANYSTNSDGSPRTYNEMVNAANMDHAVRDTRRLHVSGDDLPDYIENSARELEINRAFDDIDMPSPRPESERDISRVFTRNERNLDVDPINDEMPQSLRDRVSELNNVRSREALRESTFPGSTLRTDRTETGFDLTRRNPKTKRKLPDREEVDLGNGLTLVNNPSRVRDQSALLGRNMELKKVDDKGGGYVSLNSWKDVDGELFYYISSYMPYSTIKAGRAYKTIEGFVPKGGKVLEKVSLSYDSFKNVLSRGKSKNYELFAKGKIPMNNLARKNQFRVAPNGRHGMSFSNESDANSAIDELNELLGKHNLPKANTVKYTRTVEEGMPEQSDYGIELPNIGLKKLYAILGIGTAGAAATSQSNDFRQGGHMNSSKGDASNMLTLFENGGSHEENSLGGIPQGIGPNGKPNLVEQGETKWQDYIFSNAFDMDGNYTGEEGKKVNVFKKGGILNEPTDPPKALTPTINKPEAAKNALSFLYNKYLPTPQPPEGKKDLEVYDNLPYPMDKMDKFGLTKEKVKIRDQREQYMHPFSGVLQNPKEGVNFEPLITDEIHKWDDHDKKNKVTKTGTGTARSFLDRYNHPVTRERMRDQIGVTDENIDNMILRGLKAEKHDGGNQDGSNASAWVNPATGKDQIFFGKEHLHNEATETHERIHASKMDEPMGLVLQEVLGSAFDQKRRGTRDGKGYISSEVRSYLDKPGETYGNFAGFREELGLKPGEQIDVPTRRRLIKEKKINSNFDNIYDDDKIVEALNTIAYQENNSNKEYRLS